MITSLIVLLLYILIIGIVLWLATYIIDQVPMEPNFRRIAKVVIVVIGVVFLILLLLDFIGGLNVGFPGFGVDVDQGR